MFQLDVRLFLRAIILIIAIAFVVFLAVIVVTMAPIRP